MRLPPHSPLAMVVYMALGAHAQEVPLANIEVQSGRLQQKLQDAPASLHWIDAREIQSSGPQVNLSDVLTQVPGVVAMNRNNYAQDIQISMRGFGARTAFGLRGLRLMVDGIPATTPDGQGQASTVSMTSLGRLEVLTGPLAQLYGNASGGVIQAFTREAGERPEWDVRTYSGAFGLQRQDAQFSQRSGAVGLVADWSTFRWSGWREQSAAERQQFNGVLTYDARPGTRYQLVFNQFDMPEAQDPLGLTAAQFAQNPRAAGDNAVLDRSRKSTQQQQVGVTLNHRLEGGLHLLGRLYGGQRDNLQHQVRTTSSNGAFAQIERQFSGVGLQLQGLARDGRGGPLRWTVGWDMDQVRDLRQGGLTNTLAAASSTCAAATVPNGDISCVNRRERNASDGQGVYAQVESRGEHWSWVAGLRLSHILLRNVDGMPVTPTDPDGSGESRFSRTTPVVGLTWHASPVWNLYTQWGQGFESPTLTETAYVDTGAGVSGRFNASLKAARSQQWEWGAKSLQEDGQRLQLALFRIRTADEIVVARSAGGQTAFLNAPATQREGLEISGLQRLTPQWEALYAGTWMRAYFDQDYRYTSAGSPVTVNAGNALPGVPQRQWWSSLRWHSHPMDPRSGRRAPGTSVMLDVLARSGLWAADTNASNSQAPGYALVNLRVRHQVAVNQWQFTGHLGVDNVADRQAVGSVIVNQASARYFEPALPRNWVLGVQLRRAL